MSNNNPISRREALAAGTAFTTSLFTGQVKGANDKIRVGFIGLGAMGSGNLNYSMKVPDARARRALRRVPTPSRARRSGRAAWRIRAEIGQGFPRGARGQID